jgi:thiamine biosynthesis lipoprotein
VLACSREVAQRTGGAFDPTVGPLVRAWGFGPDKKVPVPDSLKIKTLRELVGLHKVESKNGLRKPAGVELDFSAIAKGQAVDVLGDFLERKNIKDYLVEIGGEVRCRGKNDKGEPWSIGIEDPTVDPLTQRVLAIIKLENRSMATSGNYRNFYEKDGVIYAHIIDPRTGYNARHNLLSASVFAPDCMRADAYATAFMVLGLDKSLEIVKADPKMDALFIYRADDGQLKTLVTDGIRAQLVLDESE